MNKAKVLVINNYHYRRGGADSIYFNTMELLRLRGHNVQAFSLIHPENIKDDNSIYFAKYHSLLTKSLFSRIYNLSSYFYSIEAVKGLNRLLKHFTPDIVHIHLLYGGLTSSVLSLLKRNNIPVVYSAHDYKLICPNQSFLINGKRICEACKGQKYYYALKNKCNRNNRMFSAIMGLESYFRDYCFPINRYLSIIVTSCNYGFDKHKEFRPDLVPILTRLYNLAPNLENISATIKKGNYFLFFGRLSSEKGLVTLIEAWRNVSSSCRLKIVGTGPLESTLADLIETYNLSNVELLGYQSGMDLIELIRNSSFILVPSEWYENNPMTLIEGFSYGKPGIGSSIGGIPELIQNGETGFLFQPGNVEELTDCIYKADSLSENVYASFAKNARRLVDEQCSSEIHYDQLIKIYNRAMLAQR
jgi:glycosyltransferase involved in cell wall biosynthesis